MATLGPIDILVNNAGTSWGAPAEDYPLEAWRKVIGAAVIEATPLHQLGTDDDMKGIVVLLSGGITAV